MQPRFLGKKILALLEDIWRKLIITRSDASITKNYTSQIISFGLHFNPENSKTSLRANGLKLYHIYIKIKMFLNVFRTKSEAMSKHSCFWKFYVLKVNNSWRLFKNRIKYTFSGCKMEPIVLKAINHFQGWKIKKLVFKLFNVQLSGKAVVYLAVQHYTTSPYSQRFNFLREELKDTKNKATDIWMKKENCLIFLSFTKVSIGLDGCRTSNRY